MKLSVRWRIYAGFAFVLGLAAFMGAAAIYSAWAIRESFEEFQATADQTVVVAGLTKQLDDIRLAELNYNASNERAASEEVDSGIEKLEASHLIPS